MAANESWIEVNGTEYLEQADGYDVEHFTTNLADVRRRSGDALADELKAKKIATFKPAAGVSVVLEIR